MHIVYKNTGLFNCEYNIFEDILENVEVE